MEFLTTGKLAKLTSINKETIRYYERIGLIQEPPRGKSSGYRQYPQEVITRISFIKRAQTLGFSLNEIAEILSLRHKPGSSFKDIETKVEMKLSEIEKKIASLKAMKQALSKCNRLANGLGCVLVIGFGAVDQATTKQLS